MSRVAAGFVTTTESNPIYLTRQVGPSGIVLVVSRTPSPFPDRTITMTCEAFKIFRSFMLHILRLNSRTPHLGIRGIFSNRDTTLEILYFLYVDIARLIAPQLSLQEQLECTAVALCAAAPVRDYSARPAVCLFDFSVGLKASSLVNAALNANLEEVCNILDKTHSEKRDAPLCVSSAAIITHCGTERTGTALQMALFSGDEAMVAAIKPHMDPAEFQRQWIEVFGPNYNAFLERQKIQAVELCRELRAAFTHAPVGDITNALNRVPGTTSELQDALSRFQQTLECYVRANPVHNPFILQILFEIYDQLPFDVDKLCLFSQQAIWPAEKLSSAAMLQHLAQGIYQIVEQNASLDRTFLLQGSPRRDIRSLVDSDVNCCVDMLGARAGCSWQALWCGSEILPGEVYNTFVEQKHQAWGNLCSQPRASV